jgi:hypothetical protein
VDVARNGTKKKPEAVPARSLNLGQARYHKFVFLCGLHRSGTSPLFRILREHPEISGFRDTGAPEDEGQHLQTVFSPAKFHGGPGSFGFDKQAHLTEESELVTSENRVKLFQEWSRYWDLSKPCLIEKSPPNLIRTRFLQAMFPESSFIVILRHPVAASLATTKWTSSSLESLIGHWLHCHRLFESDRQHLHTVHVLKYEDLIDSTGRQLKAIFEFLDLSPQATPALNSAGNHHYFQSWRQLEKDPGSRDSACKIRSKYERALRAFGYSFSECISENLPKSSQSALTLEKN